MTRLLVAIGGIETEARAIGVLNGAETDVFVAPRGYADSGHDGLGTSPIHPEKALREGVDLLALGSRGYGPIKRALLGSVSGHVFRHAPCPLLVTRRP